MQAQSDVLFGEWLPDQPDYGVAGSVNIRNVVPLTKNSYAPMKSLTSFSSALASTCLGGTFLRDSSNNVNGFAGTSAKLYQLTSASTTWADVSIGGGYSVAGGETWQFAQFDQRVCAVNISTATQTFVLNVSSAFANLSASAPKARYVAAVRDFMMVANTTDATNGARPQRVWWSALGDPTSWPTVGTTAALQVQSDSQDLLGDGGWNQGIVGGLVNADVGIIQERRIWRGQYVGSQSGIFAFQMVDAARGTPAPGSIVQAGGIVYFLADAGFFAFDGLNVKPVGAQKIDNFFWSDVDKGNLARMSSICMPEEQVVVWAYPGAGNSGGNPNRLLIYHYILDRFTLIDSVQVEYLLRGLTFGYTLDQLFTVLGYTFQTLPYSLDSSAWTGGRLLLAAFDTNHKLGYFQGTSLSCTMDTTEAALNDKGKAYVNRIWPLGDASAAQIQVGYRNRLADPVVWTSATAITSTSGSAGVRATGMYLRARLMIPAGATWSVALGAKVDARPAGRR